MEDASLDDFLDGGGTQEVEDDGGGDDGAPSKEDDGRAAADGNDQPADGESEPDRSGSGGDGSGGDDAADPATATYAWTPGGEYCAACGERVERRWRSAAGLVCPDCKEW